MSPETILTYDGAQQFAAGSALYDVPLKPCCGLLVGDECDCAEIAAQVESAPLVVIGGAS